jgi:hypothetical protein
LANIAGTFGAILASPLSFAAAVEAPRTMGVTTPQAAESRSVLDAWRDYALANLSSGYSFSWDGDHLVATAVPSLFDHGTGHITEPASRFAGVRLDPPALQVTYLKSRVSDTPAYAPANASGLMQEYSPGMQRYIVAPTVSQRWGDSSALSFSAIFAYQKFASLGLGTSNVPVQDSSGLMTPSVHSDAGSYGVGMRADFNSNLTETVSWQVGFQARVNMDAFNIYRGVYAEPGSFDIPASANVGVGYALTSDLKLDAGFEQVMYNQISPFTSNALPTRFLVLLGSEISPAFAWQNLSVYSVGGSWHDPTDGVWSLHYSTREQPLPTSRLLQNALEPYLATHDIEFGFSHMFGSNSSVRVAATYAPTQFVLGLPTSFSLRDNNYGNQIEYEAVWSTRF